MMMLMFSTPPELLYQLVDSTAKIIFVQPVLLPTLQEALNLPNAPKLPDNRIILLCRRPDNPDGQFKCVEEIWSEGFQPLSWKPGDETATAFLCYSSGTTGRAKGVETSHHNMTSQIQALNAAYTQLRKGQDVCLGILPFGHMYGLTLLVVSPWLARSC
jgi:acyl-CoA synthetase (AMP-forming)/AMP-acid ligase II